VSDRAVATSGFSTVGTRASTIVDGAGAVGTCVKFVHLWQNYRVRGSRQCFN